MAPPRRPNEFLQEKLTADTLAVAAIAATSSLVLQTMDGAYRINSFELEAPGGYSADASNYYVITLQAGSTVLATWSTQTGQQGALTDGVPGQAVLAGTITGAKGDVLKVVCTKAASAANLPAGTRFVAHFHEL
jgi:hypothetical protein